jgi:hypothetical protein
MDKLACDIFTFSSLENLSDPRLLFKCKDMKHLKEKLKRQVKYMRVSYQQARGRERLNLYMFAMLLLIYAWWVIIAL